MSRKSMKVKLEEYMHRKAEDMRERERNNNNKDLHPGHPDNR